MTSDDDDAAAIHGGPLKYWLEYRVWGVKGQWLVAAALLAGVALGAWLA